MTAKAKPVPTPRALRVTDNVPDGAELRLTPDAVRLLVRLFGEEALQRATERSPRDD